MEEAFEWAKGVWENRPDFLKWKDGAPMLMGDEITVEGTAMTKDPYIKRPKVFQNIRNNIDMVANNAREAIGLKDPAISRTGHQMSAYRNMALKLSNPQTYKKSSQPLAFNLNKTKIKPLNKKPTMLSQAYGGAGSYRV